MNYFKISIIGIILFIASCDEAADDTSCVDSTAAVLAASEAYGTDMSYSDCQVLKTAALDFGSNSCDTSGVGDLNFIIDSLDCNEMACALPLSNLIAYGLSMQTVTDSATYCMLFDSTMMAADTLLKYNCWGEDSTAYYTAYFDSVEAAGCDPNTDQDTLVVNDTIRFSDLTTLFENKCYQCHSEPEYSFYALNLDSYENTMSGSQNGSMVTPYEPEQSLLYTKCSGEHSSGQRMPQDDLTFFDEHPEKLKLIYDWIYFGCLE